MKIAFATYAFPPEGSNGGLATFYFELSRALASLGHEVLVVTLSEFESKSEIIEGVRVERIKFDDSFASNLEQLTALPSLSWFLPRMLRLHRQARPFVDQFGPDVIECAEHGFLWLLDAANRNQPLVLRCLCPAVHSLTVDAARTTKVDMNLLLAMEAHLIRSADALTTPSASLASIVSQYAGVSTADFRIIKNPLELPSKADSAADASDPNNDFPRITYVGRVEYLKGSDLLIEMLPHVLAKYPKARLTMIGLDTAFIGETTSYGVKLRTRLEELGCVDRVHFTGAVERHQIRHYLDESDFCMFPSRYDSSPYACLESMSYGIPVIAADIGGIPEYIEHGVSGILVPAEDPVGLADAAINLASDAELRKRLGAAARESIIQNLNPAKIASESVELYQEAIQRYLHDEQRHRKRSGPDPVLKAIIDGYDDFAVNDYIGQNRQVLLDAAYQYGFTDGVKHAQILMGAGDHLKHLLHSIKIKTLGKHGRKS